MQTTTCSKVEITNILLIVALTLIEAVQVVIIVALVTSFIPFHFTQFVETLFLTHRRSIKPERELLIYHCSIVFAFCFQSITVWLLRKRLNDPNLKEDLLPLIYTDLSWVILQLFAVFKIFVYNDPPWARFLLYVFLGLSILSRVFWPELTKAGKNVLATIRQGKIILPAWVAPLALAVFLVFALCPNMDAVLGRTFTLTNFIYVDAFLMRQDSGLSLVMSWISRIVGGYDHAHVMGLMICLDIAYFILFYFLLKAMFKSTLLSLCGTLLALKLQVFNLGISPLVWMYPWATPLFSYLDLFVFLLLWAHQRYGHSSILILAGVYVGAALALMLHTGLCLYAAFLFFTGFKCVEKLVQEKSLSLVFVRFWGGIFILPAVVALGLILLFSIPCRIDAHWLANSFDIRQALTQNYFFAYVAAFVVAGIYFFSWLWLSLSLKRRRAHEHSLLIACVCVYALGRFLEFTHNPIPNGYYNTAAALVLVLCFWWRVISQHWDKARVNIIHGYACMLLVGALLTNHVFTIYPNCLNIARMDWRGEIENYKHNGH